MNKVENDAPNQENVDKGEMLLLQKVNAIINALSLQKVNCDREVALRIIRTYEGVMQHGNEFSLKHIEAIDAEIEARKAMAQNSQPNKVPLAELSDGN